MRSLFYTLVAVTILLQAKSQTAGSQTKTAAQVSAVYPSYWTNLNFQSFTADDNLYCYIKKFTGSLTGHLFLSGFGFSIPTNAIIDNITLTVRKFATGGVVKDYYVSLINSCCSKGPNLTTLNPWPISETNVLYTEGGTGTDYAGNPYVWTPAEINDHSFTVLLHAQKNLGKPANIYFEQVTVKVDYTTPSITIASKPLKKELPGDKQKESISIKAFQNNILVTTVNAGKYSLVITDILGRQLEQKIIYTTENSPMIIPIDRKLNGIYFITCTGNGFMKTIKSFLQ